MITIHDVAREAGVSISTVSNVVNGVNKVAPATRGRVLEVVKRLNYYPNTNARTLKTGRRNTIGLFVSSIQGDYYTTLAQTIHRECKAAGYQMNVYVSNDNTGEEVFVSIVSSGVAGAIIMNEALSQPLIERLRLRGLPMVFIDRELSGALISSVIIDNYRGVKEAMAHLIALGHTRIGFIRGLDNRDGQDRLRAYRDSLKEHGLPADMPVLDGNFEESVTYTRMKDYLEGGGTLPEAFCAANDESAWGCVRALNEAGYRVPGDISVMGFDDITMAAYYTPSLSTVYNPVLELGNAAAVELLRLMDSPTGTPGSSQRVSPRLVLRDSCRAV